MGYEFDDNGKYIGWSDLFNYSGIKELRASEYLPIPNGVTYVKQKDGFDISEQIINVASRTTESEKIRAYADLLNELQDQKANSDNTLNITWNENIPDNIAEEVLNNLNKHSLTYISPQKIEKCLKNKVSSSISNIIQNLRNMDLAYSPIKMDIVRKAAEKSAKGEKSSRMTLLNPLTKLLMQEQNMVGKGVIGITAVGEKVFFNVSHYWNEGIRSRDEKWIKNLQFSQRFNRIEGRSQGELIPVIKTTLANVNFESVEEMRLRFEKISGIDEQLRSKYGITNEDIEQKTDKWRIYRDKLMDIIRQRQDSDINADEIISQLLSAATDNAKELILDKINAGSNLAKCYLHLIMMGFNVADIAAFMTSPVVSIINDLSTSNMFDEYLYNIRITDIIKVLKGNFPLNKFFYGTVYVKGEQTPLIKEAFKAVSGKLQPALRNLGYTTTEEVKQGNEIVEIQVPAKYYSLYDIIQDYYDARIKGLITESLSSFIFNPKANTQINNNLLALSDYIDSVINKISNLDPEQFEADLEEFEKVYNLSNETSALGSTLLGLNQGIPSSKQDILNKVFQIQKAMYDREKTFNITPSSLRNKKEREGIIARILENNSFLTKEDVESALSRAKELGISGGRFDFFKWLENSNGYREATADYYNLIKGTWNIFDIVDRLPHYNSIFQAFQAVLIADDNLIKKSRLLNVISKDIYDKSDYIDSDNIKNLLNYVNDLLILRYLNKQGFKYPIFEGNTLFKQNWDEYIYKGSPILATINDEVSRGTFKKYIEEYLFPNLQNGYYYDVDENGNAIKKEIGKNKFIDTLFIDINMQDQPYLKLDLNMQNVSFTPNNESLYQECLSDFIKLKQFKLNGIELTNWFMLYNLIVNKNQYGANYLTSLFGSFINITEYDSMIKSIMNMTGEFDYDDINIQSTQDLEQLGYNLNDALYRIAPTIRKSQESNSNYPMVKEIVQGREIVKRKKFDGRGYGNPIELILDSSGLYMNEESSLLSKLKRYQNSILYGTIKTPFATMKSSNITNLKSDNVELVLSALQNYLKQGILEIYTKNC